MSTRMVGALVMAHGDDSGLVMPPRVAPIQVVIVPIYRDADSRAKVEAFIGGWTPELKAAGIRHRIDWRVERPGDKYAHWELKGVPLRLNVGSRDADAGQGEMVDRLSRARVSVPVSGIAHRLRTELDAFQKKLFDRALAFQRENTFELSTLAEVVAHFKERAGFVLMLWCGDEACENRLKAESGWATMRCIGPYTEPSGTGLVCARPAPTPRPLAKVSST